MILFLRYIFITITFVSLFLVGFTQPANNDCSNATNLGTLTNTNQLCANGETNVNATPDIPYITLKNCDGNGGDLASPAQDVWYKFKVDSGEQLLVEITGALANPQIALWEGSCDQLVGRGCATGSGSALTYTFNGLTPDAYSTGKTYYLQVQGSTANEEGNFDLCLTSSTDTATCLIVSELTATPAPEYGAYKQSTEVEFCYTILYFHQLPEIGISNFMHGIAPIFGSGWDAASFTVTKTSTSAGSGDWGYYTSVPTPSNGNVDGFFYDSPDPDPMDGDPSNNFGDGSAGPWEFCWKISTPAIGSCTEGADLSIEILNFADGETGFLAQNHCDNDPNFTFNSYSLCCLDPSVLSKDDVTCFGLSDGSTKVTGSGTSPFTYQWSTGETVQEINNLAAANYTITVTDVRGCVTNSAITISEPTVISLSTGSTAATCGLNDGTAGVTASNGTPGYTYSWTSGGTATTETSLGIGTYTVTVRDQNNCEQITIVNVVSSEDVITSSSDVSCNGLSDGQASINVNGGNPPFTYQWSTGETTSSISNLAVGDYTVTIIDNNTCMINISTYSITEPSAMTLNMSSQKACPGGNDGSASVNVSGGQTPYKSFKWSTNQGGTTILGLGAGTYAVTVVDQNNCIAFNSIAVTASAAMNLTISKTDISCASETDGIARITVSGGTSPYTYKWSSGGSVVDTVTGLSAGPIAVTVTDDAGCKSFDTLTIVDPDTVKIESDKTDVTTCNGSDGTATASGIGGAKPYTYIWDNGGTTATITSLQAGTFIVSVIDFNGCLNMDTVLVNDSAAPLLLVNDLTSPSCFGGSDGSASISIVAGTGISPFTYLWSNGQTTITATGLPKGTHTATTTGSDGCKGSMFVIVTEPTVLSNQGALFNVNCFGESNGQIILFPSGATPAYAYAWSTIPQQTDSIATGLIAGTYTVTINDANGCNNIWVYPISEPSLLTLSLDSIDITCNGSNDGAAIATPSGGTTPYSYLWSTGGTGFSIIGLSETMYKATITDANGCIVIDSIFVNDPPPIISSIIDTTNVSCKNGTDGSATVTQTGGTGPYNYGWSPSGGSNAKGVNMSQGNYTATITDNNGCQSTSSVTLTEPATSLALAITYTLNPTCGNADGAAAVTPSGGVAGYSYKWGTNPVQADSLATALVGQTDITVTVSDANSCSSIDTINLQAELRTQEFQTDVSCFAGSDGIAGITPLSGTPPFSYAWAPNVSNDSIATGISAGVYVVQIDDINCAANRVITVTEPPAYAVDIPDSTNVSCKDGSDGSARAVASGGTPGYSYSWSNIDNDSIITNLIAGSYVITAYDSKNCPALATVVITEPDSLLLYTAQTNVSCFGGSDGTARVSGSGGTKPYAFIWTTLATDSNVNGLPIGSYTVTVTDFLNCRNTASITLTEPLPLIGSITDSTNVSCFGGNDGIATITPSQGTPSYTYSWNTNPVQTDSTASGLAAGSTSVEITDSNGCKSTYAVILQQPTQVIIDTLSVTHASCNGISDGAIRVSAGEGTPPYSYKWNTNPIQSDSLAIILSANDYVVTVVDAQSCTTTRTVTVTEPLTLLFNTMDSTNVSCKDGIDGTAEVNPIGGTTPYSYLWSHGATTKSVTNLSAGLFTTRVTDFKGCINTDTVNITEPDTMFAFVIAKKDITCFKGSDGSTSASGSGGTPPFNYVWSTGTADSTDNSLPLGTYTITVTDNLGCLDTAKITLLEPGPMVATPKTSQDTICIGQTATIIAFGTGGNGSYTYLWNTGSTSNTIFASPIVDSTYTITITDSLGCSIDSSILIPVYDSLKVTATSDDYLLCQGQETVIRAAPEGGNGHYLFNWVADQGGLGDQQKVLIKPSQTTTYFLTLSDDCGSPVATDSVKVNVLSINFEPLTASGCPPLKVEFKDLSNTDSTNVWSWDFGDGNTSTEQNPVNVYEFTGSYDVTLSVKTQQGCTSDKTLPNMVIVYPSPVASFSINPSTATTLTTFNFSDKSEGHIKLLWDFGDGSIDSINTDPQHSYEDTGHYNVALITYNEYGCTDTLVHTIYTGPEFIFYVPNAFTPNGDGINDYFYGAGVGIAEFKMSIFNKWGGLVFVTENPKEKWKGSVDNTDNIYSNSIFIYLIEIKDYFGIDHRYIGHVTLVR